MKKLLLSMLLCIPGALLSMESGEKEEATGVESVSPVENNERVSDIGMDQIVAQMGNLSTNNSTVQRSSASIAHDFRAAQNIVPKDMSSLNLKIGILNRLAMEAQYNLDQGLARAIANASHKLQNPRQPRSTKQQIKVKFPRFD